MAAAQGTAQGTVTLDYSQFEAASKAILGICGSISATIRNTLVVAFGDLISKAIQTAIGAMKSFVSSAIENTLAVIKLGEELALMSHATGIAASSWLAFKLAMEKGITLREAADLLGKNADLLQKDAGLFRDIAIRLEGVSLRFQGFWIGFADKVAPVINAVLEKINRMDFTAWGQKIGAAFSSAFETLYGLIKTGNVWNAIVLTLKVGFAEAANYLVFGGKTFITLLTTFFVELPSLMITGFETALGYLKNNLVNILQLFGKYLPFSGIGFAVNAFGGGKDGKQESITDILAKIVANPEFKDVTGAGALVEELKKLLGEQGQGAFADDGNPNSFSNRRAIENFGVSSLQKLGLGGTVNGPGGGEDPLVTIGNKQIDLLASIRDATNAKNSTAVTFPYDPRQAGPVKVAIT